MNAATYVSAAAFRTLFTPATSPRTVRCHLLQNDFRSPRGVEFHRKRDQLEDQQDQIAIDAKRNQPGDMKEESAQNHERQHLRRDHCYRHNRHARFQWRVRFRVLNGVTGLVRSNPQRRYGRRVVHAAGEVQLLVSRVVMVSKKIVRLHNIDIVNLGRLQNFTRAFSTGDVRTRPHFAHLWNALVTRICAQIPITTDADIKQPVRSKTETVWIKHTELNLMYRSQLSLYWLEQIRRSNDCFVHLGRDIAPG